jgi:NADPH2:quinone reductase
MRAAIVREFGSGPEVGEFDDPVATADGHAVVEILAGGLNPVDLSIATGRFYGGAPPLPYVPGREGVGRLTDGTRVYFDSGVAPYGSFAERTLIERSGAVALPDGLDEGIAVALGIAGLAAWLALEWRAHLQAGETVIVLGATGVVGQIAVQAARLLGAGRVVAVGRNADRLAPLLGLGADAIVAMDGEDDLAAALREAADGGVDVVIDPLWGAPAAAAIETLRLRGRLVQIGQSAGAQATIASATVRGRLLSILGHTNFAVPLDVRQDAYRRMAGHARDGAITVDVERVPLDDIAAAWERQRAAPGLKLVVVP